jgi:hypothetical protein
MRYTKRMSTSSLAVHLRTHGRPHGLLARWFPTPSLLVRVGAGVDISDNSIKWIELTAAPHGWEIGVYGYAALDAGIVVEGVVKDAVKLGAAIAALRANFGA